MQIQYKIQKDTDRNNNDMRVINTVRLGLIGAILISAVTNFLGFEEWSEDYLLNVWWLWKWFLLGVAFVLFCFLPDSIVSNFVRYATAQVYDKKVNGVDSWIVIVFVCIIVAALATYSFKLSKNSGELKAADIAGDAKVKDVEAIDSTYFLQQQVIDSKREKAETDARGRIQEQAKALILPLQSEVERHQSTIQNLERMRSKDNTQYISKQQNSYRRRITALNKRISNITTEYALKADTAASHAVNRYDKDIDLLGRSYQENRDSTVVQNGRVFAGHNRLSSVFISTIKGLSGWSVFVVILLSLVLEVLYKRNGLEPAPVFENFDFQPSPVIEVLKLPFVMVGRYVLNYVREKYNTLDKPVIRTDILFHDVPDLMQVLREYDAKILAENGKKVVKNGASYTAAQPLKTANGESLLTAAVNGQKQTAKENCKNGRCKPKNGDDKNGQLVLTGDERVAVKIIEKVPTIICLHCGTESEKTAHNKKFCSDQCKTDHHAQKHGGKPFDPNYVYKN